MRIGIITIHKSPSYGGSLQSFALYKYLSDKGYQVEIMDVFRPTHAGYQCSLGHLHNRFSVKERIRYYLKALLGIRSKVKNKQAYNECFKAFNDGISYSRPYRSARELYKDPPKYDVYVTGSDQVWNPTQPYLIEPYFLTFVKDGNARKISYAASVGIEALLPHEREKFKQWIERYDSVSVREEGLRSYLESFVNKSITRVADPSFLLDRAYWKRMAKSPDRTTPYILLFELAHNPSLIAFCLRLSEQSGLRLIVLDQNEPPCKDNSYEVENMAGPLEFIGYIADAEMVITDSFHGTVFSIIMETKNFYTYISPTNQRGSRIMDLLRHHEALDHLLVPDLKQRWAELRDNPIKRELMDACYSKEQGLSRAFLDGCLPQ